MQTWLQQLDSPQASPQDLAQFRYLSRTLSTTLQGDLTLLQGSAAPQHYTRPLVEAFKRILSHRFLRD